MRPVRSLLAARLLSSSPAQLHFNRRLQPSLQLQKTPCIRCQFQSRQTLLFRNYSSESDEKKPNNAGPQKASLSNALPSSDASELKNLPSQQERRRSDISKRFSNAMEELQTTLFSAGRKLNEVTGYSDIESLKKSIEQQEINVKAARQEVRKAKEEYQNAINRRSGSQREVNELLQRKHAWSPTDLERFTELYRSDHANEQEESLAEERLTKAEKTAEEAQELLGRSILARYHEEQIWSDKIRRASTWGTWGLMGFNVLLFIIVQLGLEPWRRRRLVRGFEEKVREVIEEENIISALMRITPENQEVVDTIEKFTDDALVTEGIAIAGAEEVTEEVHDVEESPAPSTVTTIEGEEPNSVKEEIENVERKEDGYESFRDSIKGVMDEYLSEKEVVIRQVDLTNLALQSAGAGAFLAAIISLILSQR